MTDRDFPEHEPARDLPGYMDAVRPPTNVTPLSRRQPLDPVDSWVSDINDGVDAKPLRHAVERDGPEWTEALQTIIKAAKLLNLPAPCSITLTEGLPVELHFSRDSLTDVDDWTVGLVLPEATLGDKVYDTPDSWRKYSSVGERHGHRYEVWTSKRVRS